VIAAVRRIPPGRVATYGDIAALAGQPRAWRAVGNIMRECRDPQIPCHRVIAAGGRLGGYGGHASMKRQLLELEGCVVQAGRVRDFDTRRCRLTRRRGQERTT
jgi:O-6-methylguanine DNA methyltransferase